MPRVTINNRIQTVPEGTCLSDLLPGELHPCGGKGICGKCLVRAWGALSPLSPEERRHLTALEIADGARLACCTTVVGDCQVETRDTAPLAICIEGESVPLCLNPSFSGCGAAVDVGTTTLAARLYAADGTLLAEQGAPNPQVAFGADVITRVQAVQQGKGETITGAIRQGVCDLLTHLFADAGLPLSRLEELVITGNTVMLTLLTGGDVTPFATAPFVGCSRFGVTLSGALVGLTDCPDAAVYLAPCAAAFLGGDTVTALLATDLPDKSLLLDIGTNGEIVLCANGTLYACSTAAGPAFEGVGISCGMVAAPGAIDRAELVNGRLYPHVMGEGTATGVCGSGLVDALACLQLTDNENGPVSLAPGITLTTEDIQALLTSKSAIRSGMDTLLYTAGLSSEEVSSLTIAGGFGRYLNIPNATRIGLLPPIPIDRIRVVGNAALSGASRLLLDAELRSTAQQLAAAIQVVDLATNSYFAQQFVANMTLEVTR